MPKNDYPQLTAMGILNPLQIDRYQVNSISNFDVLRVIYQRGEGSFLPSSVLINWSFLSKISKTTSDSEVSFK